jgi:phosphoribosylanthranilate isomerase
MPDVWIKFCGCTGSHDVELAAHAGADAFGMIFAPSPRRVTWEAAVDIAARAPASIEAVAVFVNPVRDEVERVRSIFPNARLQFSGDESPQFVANYGERAIKAIHVGANDADVGQAGALFPYALLLFDSHDDTLAGGTGKPFAWDRVAATANERAIVVAGGLTPENVGPCIDEVHPFGVDVRSGIESDGRKDPAKMRAFVHAVRRR